MRLRILPTTAMLLAAVMVGCSGETPESDTADDSGAEITQPSEAVDELTLALAHSDHAAAYYSLSERLGREWLGQFEDVRTEAALTQSHRAALKAHQSEIAELLKLSQPLPVDLGFSMSRGTDALLPHLAPMRDLAKVLAADAIRLAAAGQPDPAADRLIAAIRMSRQLADDQLILSTLLAYANLNLILEVTQGLVDRTLLHDSSRVRIASELREIDTEDPLNARAAALNDINVLVYSLRNDLLHPEGAGAKIRDYSPAQIAAGADEIERLRAVVADAWDRVDSASALEQVDTDIRAPVARAVFPRMAAFRRETTRTSRAIERFIKRLTP